MKGRWLLAALAVGACSCIVLGAAVWWWMIQRAAQSPESVDSAGGSIALNMNGGQGVQGMSLSTDSSTGSTGGAGSTGGGASGPSSAGGQVKGAADSSAGPSREELATYDKFKDSQEVHYGDLRSGNGPEVAAGKTLTVNYRGWLTDGRLFDDSYAKGRVFSFAVGQNRVIPGFEAGLAGMRVGGKRRIIVPPAGGYGEQPANGIPAHSVLVFDVELLQVQ